MKLDTSKLFLLRNWFYLYICIELSSCMNNVTNCGKYKSRLRGLLIVTCFDHIFHNSNSVCENLPDYMELNGKEIPSPNSIELKDCSLKPGIFESINLNMLQFLSSSNNTITVLQKNSFHKMCLLHSLTLKNDSIEVIEPSSFSCLSRVSDLDLESNKIELLPVDVFKDMASLGWISLKNNKIPALPVGIFDNLIYLDYLDLGLNYIKSLPDNLFAQLIYIQFLFIYENRIDALNERILLNLTKLTYLSFSGNQIKSLGNVFSQNAKVNVLLIQENDGLILDKDTFRGLHGLKQLRMDRCNIASLPNGVFKETPYLYTLEMVVNSLREINSDSFDLLRNLYYLNVSSNEISELRGQPFKHNVNLNQLGLSKNKLSEIKRDSFQGLISLEILDISFNYISKIDGNAFKNMSKLKDLKLNDNVLTVLFGLYSLGRSNILHQVDVSNNRLTDIRNINWQQLPFLRNFIAINNTIYDLFVTNFTTNQSLNVHLEFNKVKYIYLNTTKNENESTVAAVNQFYMEGNPIECDCHAYNLYMYMSRTPMAKATFYEGVFCQKPYQYKNMSIMKLKPTDFICNITELCPENCSCTYAISDNVRMVNCSNGSHTHLPILVPYNTNVLDISHNNLTSLDGLNDKMWENLTDIHAEYNAITSDVLFLPQNIKVFTLHHNKLKKLPESIKLEFKRKKDFKITISNNLWPCDCSIIYFNQYVNHIVDVRNVHYIFSNNSLSYTNVIGLKEEDICPVAQYIQYIISSIVIFILICILVFYYRHKVYVLYFMYSHFNSCYILFRRKPKRESNLFDCFISYSSADREVTLAILAELEDKPPNYKFCIHERNWLPGQYITNNIVKSVQNSRKTLIVISKTFLQSSWFYLEFEAAYQKTLEDRTDGLIVILKGELPDEKELDSDVLFVISSKTYLQWGERWFWEKLRYAIYSENDFPEQNITSCFRRLTSCFVKKNSLDQQEFVLNDEVT